MASKTETPPPYVRPVKYPEQLVILVSQETADRIADDSRRHQLSKSEVARTYLEAGIDRADEIAEMR